MNIFFLSLDPKLCAIYHVDKHVIKMILEVAQLLCSAIWIVNPEVSPPYKLTHKNHPCAKWTRESKDNWYWLQSLGLELCYEYSYRYGKVHSVENVIENLSVPNLPEIGFTTPPLCMSDEYKSDNFIDSYRKLYTLGKKHLHSWNGAKSGIYGSRAVPWFVKS